MKFMVNWNYRIRRTHRYMGVLLGIQFFMWTIGGLYFSWSNMDEIHGDFQKKAPPQLLRTSQGQGTDLAFVSPSIAVKNLKTKLEFDALLNIALIDVLGKPTYRLEYLHGGHHKMYQLADAQTGDLRDPLSIEEATALAKQQYNGEPKVKSVESLKEVNGHHEYRESPLPAVAVTFEKPMSTTVYVATEMGIVTKYRNDKWRIFDFLWMLHTMDYQSRDNIGNWLLRAFSIFGLLTIASGFTLFFISRKKHSS
jgi:uncharacterized iron-regulated membrane protein